MKKIRDKIKDKLLVLRPSEEIAKNEVVGLIWGKKQANDYFIRRTFDVHLCEAKKELKKELKREYATRNHDLIKRIK